jgi:hypothetical protein
MAEEELSGFPIKGIRLSRANLLWTFIDWSAWSLADRQIANPRTRKAHGR